MPPLWSTLRRPRPLLYEHDDRNGSEGPDLLPKAVPRRELHAGRGPALVFDLIRHADGTRHLVLSWNHSLLDARGMDLILNHLNAKNQQNGAPGVRDLFHPLQGGWNPLGWFGCLVRAHGSVKWLNASGREPLFSLVPKGPAPRHCRNLFRLISFTREETARIAARCERMNCGFRRSHFYLAVCVRAFHRLAKRRGNHHAAYLIPTPHDTRRRGANGPIFSNHLSILFYRIEREQAGDLSAVLAELSRQMTDQIRDRFPECCMAALDMFKPILPLPWYGHHLGKPTRGKFASFCFSDSGETCAGIERLFGGRILEVAHLVPTWRPPGLTIVFLSFDGRLSALLSWVDDCLSAEEAASLEAEIRTGLIQDENL
jgi:hypothetical protein